MVKKHNIKITDMFYLNSLHCVFLSYSFNDNALNHGEFELWTLVTLHPTKQSCFTICIICGWQRLHTRVHIIWNCRCSFERRFVFPFRLILSIFCAKSMIFCASSLVQYFKMLKKNFEKFSIDLSALSYLDDIIVISSSTSPALFFWRPLATNIINI